MVLILLMRALMSVCTVVSSTILKRVGLNISLIVRPILIGKVLIFAGLLLSCSRPSLQLHQEPELPHIEYPWLEGTAGLNWISCWNLDGRVSIGGERVTG